MRASTRLCAAAVLAAGSALAAPVWAQSCPPEAVDQSARTAEHEALRAAPDAATARVHSDRLWAQWTKAPDAQAQELLDFGMLRLRVSDYEAAEGAFDRLVEYCPDYAEGYNQRAFSHYLREDFEPALADLDRALDRNPMHVGALSGRALTLMGLGRDAEALKQLEAALEVHPWLNERGLVPVLKQRLGARDI